MKEFFCAEALSVGYHGQSLIRDICFQIGRGKILGLIGPNGAGKSTILKSISRQLAPLGGTVTLDGRELAGHTPKELAEKLSLVLTERVRPELVTCEELVAMGRYPHTNLFGRMTAKDREAVHRALEQVHALELKDRDFTTLSDGQRQRILLARAICQEPQLMILDEPTAYLDIRHKIQLLDILREMVRERNITVILSLHEIDLAAKVSDYLMCVSGDSIAAFGPAGQIMEDCSMEELYQIRQGSYNPVFGSVELSKPQGTPCVFVVGGGGQATPCYRELQKRQIPFATGILLENDIDLQTARCLSDHIVSACAFEPMTQQQLDEASALLMQCEAVVDAGTPVGSMNWANGSLLALAAEKKLPIYRQQEKKEQRK